MIETSSKIAWKQLATFGNLQKSLEMVRKCSYELQTVFGEFSKSSETFGHLQEIARISLIFGYLYSKKNISCPLVETNFIFSCSTRYFSCLLRSLVRYRVEHSKIKFVSTRGHVISRSSFNKAALLMRLKSITNATLVQILLQMSFEAV